MGEIWTDLDRLDERLTKFQSFLKSWKLLVEKYSSKWRNEMGKCKHFFSFKNSSKWSMLNKVSRLKCKKLFRDFLFKEKDKNVSFSTNHYSFFTKKAGENWKKVSATIFRQIPLKLTRHIIRSNSELFESRNILAILRNIAKRTYLTYSLHS